ncbi:MAG: MBL fold metallo-hydrolase [Geodermatophilaceae bacterium]|nr:MBL fold metallo-hydrolase [Geodermatophilaceae bacterium]MDQ3454622.1 MBL fold metallo-hydrolase [Actinomycetota bacterium]
MTGWVEVADGVLQGRYEPYDVTVAVVRGADGLLVVDTRGSRRQGDELRDDLRVLGRPVRCAVNTHGHFDHCFGNQCFGPGMPIYGHERLPAQFAEHEAPMLARAVSWGVEGSEEFRDVVLTPPTRLVGAEERVDLGDRVVDLLHLGRGHTDNDLVLHVDGTWIVGDLVEESGPPAYGKDSFPLEWPDTLAALLPRLAEDSVVLPGHGAAVDGTFVRRQCDDITVVADLIAVLHAAGVPVERALAEGGLRWPFAPEGLAEAVRRGYAQIG